MAERVKNRQNIGSIFFGTLITSNVDSARISRIKLPELDNRFTTISAGDLFGDNIFTLFSGTMPIFAKGEVLFKGQPILAIFGPDYEAVSLAERETEIEYEEKGSESTLFDNLKDDEETLIWGDKDELDLNSLTKVESTYKSNYSLTHNDTLVKVSAWFENDTLHISVPTQWTKSLKDNVLSSISGQVDNVIIHPIIYSAEEDEFLIMPTLLACIVANAALKLKANVEIRANICSATPSVTINHTTYLNSEGKPVGEEVSYVADEGAFLFETGEFKRQALTGLIPSYPVGYFRASVRTIHSNNPPSIFFGNMGFCDALASTELQMTKICSTIGNTPVNWKKEFIGTKRKFTDYLPSLDLTPQIKLIEKIVNDSNFSRKWSSYEAQRGAMSIIPFTRGIGIATGFGISGFSTTFAKKTDFKAQLVYCPNDRVELYTSLPIRGNVGEIIKKLINDETMFQDSDVRIFDYTTSATDSGPDVLSRSLGQLTKQLIPALRKLSMKAKRGQLPVSVSVDIDDKLNPCEFESCGTVGVIIETRVDNISFLPIVQEVWISCRLGTIYDSKEVKSRIANVALEALKSSGAILSIDPKKPFKFNINLESDNTYNIASISAAVSGCVKAAFGSSVLQCVPRLKNSTLPISASMIQNAITRK